MAKKETKIQIIVSYRSYPMRNRKFQTNSKKIQKIIKKQSWLLFKQKLIRNGRERDQNTNYRFVSFRSCPMRNRKFQKNSKKIQKIIKYYYGFI